MKYGKPDGEIEIEGSGCCCPPGEVRRGQHTNSATQWVRVNRSPWRQIEYGSSHVRTLAAAANTCREFEEELDKIIVAPPAEKR